jgi:uncharacterized repeat protein (TIGR03803 family)
MKNHLLLISLAALALLLTTTAQSQVTESVIYSFPQTSHDAAVPEAGLVFDSAGNLYGTTIGGGTSGFGAVYELSPAAGGGWTEQVLYSFTAGTDGSGPKSTLAIDPSGNLFGVTMAGGTGSCPGGCGTVFELSNTGSGWTRTTVYSFSGGGDGRSPSGSLLLDAAGNLYGVTAQGGAHTFGVVYKISPTSTGWHQSVLYSFPGPTITIPWSTLAMDAGGNLYGTTLRGGSHGRGSVFELSPPSLHSWWTFQTIHSFDGPDGTQPTLDALIIDAAGNLYGSTSSGGNATSANGTVYRLSPTSGGHFNETVLHSFSTGSNGGLPEGGLAFDPSGNLWGTTSTYGGTSGNGFGTVFELTPVAGGHWSFATVYSFVASGDAAVPLAKLVFDSAGNGYGTSEFGGTTADQEGTVFEISPLAAKSRD